MHLIKYSCWEDVPTTLKTKPQLREMGLHRVIKQQQPVAKINTQQKNGLFLLYDISNIKIPDKQGSGWHGDTPGHKAAAEIARHKYIMRTSMSLVTARNLTFEGGGALDESGKAPEHRTAARKGILNDCLRTPLTQQIKIYEGWADVPKNLLTKSTLGKNGLKPLNLNAPVAKVHDSYRGETYNLYAVDTAINKRKVTEIAPKTPPITIENIGLALHTINKAAKRRRDAAESSYCFKNHTMARMQKDEKEKLYSLKNKTMAKAIADGIAKFEGVHSQTRPSRSDIEKKRVTYLNCYSIATFSFHEITTRPKDKTVEIKPLGDWISQAAPRGKVKIKDAVATLEKYLEKGVDYER